SLALARYSSFAGFLTSNVFPSAASTHFPLMNNCFVPFKNSETFGVVSITLAYLISSRFYFFFFLSRKSFYYIFEFVMMKYIESQVCISLSFAGIKRMHIRSIPSFKIFKQEFSIFIKNQSG